MNFTRNYEKWQSIGFGFSLDGSGEAESLKDNGGGKPADEIDQTTLTESGIVFADSVPRIGKNA
jgi:hypothetical protein